MRSFSHRNRFVARTRHHRTPATGQPCVGLAAVASQATSPPPTSALGRTDGTAPAVQPHSGGGPAPSQSPDSATGSRPPNAGLPSEPHPLDDGRDIQKDLEEALTSAGALGVPIERGPSGIELAVLDDNMRPTSVHPFDTPSPVPIATGCFQGHVFARMQSPGDAYFEGCNHNFELQVQGTFRCPDAGALFFGVELPSALKLPVLKQAIAGLMKRFLETWGTDVLVSFGNPESGDCARVSVPLLAGIHRIVPTAAGYPLPVLGQQLQRTVGEAKLKQRPSVGATFLPQTTYTMALYSMFFDLVRWELTNIPGLRRLPLQQLCPSFRLVVYAATADRATHAVGVRTPVWQLQVTRCTKSKAGPEAQPATDRGGRWRGDQRQTKKDSSIVPDAPDLAEAVCYRHLAILADITSDRPLPGLALLNTLARSSPP